MRVTKKQKESQLLEQIKLIAKTEKDDHRCKYWEGDHDEHGRPIFKGKRVAWLVLSELYPDQVNRPRYKTRHRLKMRCGYSGCSSPNHIQIDPLSSAHSERNRRAQRVRDAEILASQPITEALCRPWRRTPLALMENVA